jgi:CRP-like cAMP-binding protein
LFGQGDKVAAIYFVDAGRLRLERRTFDGRLLILGITPAGQFFVEAALFADIFHCDAVAAEPSQVSVYPKEAVLQALRSDPGNAMSFLALMAHQVIDLRQRLELMKVHSAKERVMLYFDFHADVDGGVVNLRSQLQDIAGELGLSREAFIAHSPVLNEKVQSNGPGLVSCSKDRLPSDPQGSRRLKGSATISLP